MTLLTPNSAGKLVLLIAGALTLGLVAVTPAIAGDGDVPFAAELTGTAAFTSPTTVEFHGEGHATHLGRFVGGGLAILEPSTGSCPGGAAGIPNVHVETLSAADEDELVIRMVNVACPTGPYTFHGSGHWSVLAGTGRFEGVTGAGTNEGDADFETGTFALTLTGTLSYR